MRHNVVVVLIDTLRPDHLGLYGYERQTAPFLNELAASSTVFRRAYSTSSWTAPATASLFTSTYPTQHGVTSGFFASREMQNHIAHAGSTGMTVNAIPSSLATMPEVFRASGYRTFGVSANVNIGDEMGFDRGFDQFEQLHELEIGSAGHAEEIETQLEAWDSQIRGAEPAFVYLHFNDVHNPYERRRPWYHPQEGLLADTIAAYDSEIRVVDETLRRIFDRFGWAADDASEAIVAIVSDHGEEFREHGERFHKLSLYRELVQVVTMIRVPSGLGRSEYVNVGLVDLLPTLLDLADLPPPEATEGRSLAPIVAGESTDQANELHRQLEDRALYAHRRGTRDGDDRVLQAVVEGNLHLIQGPNNVQLFDVASDPLEQHDLASRRPIDVERLLARLREFEALGSASGAQENPSSTEIELDHLAVEELQALGYVE